MWIARGVYSISPPVSGAIHLYVDRGQGLVMELPIPDRMNCAIGHIKNLVSATATASQRSSTQSPFMWTTVEEAYCRLPKKHIPHHGSQRNNSVLPYFTACEVRLHV